MAAAIAAAASAAMGVARRQWLTVAGPILMPEASLVEAPDDAAHAAGAIRTALAESTTSVLTAAAFGCVVMCWRRGALAGEAVALVATALIAVEALSFGMAIPTVTDRDERLSATQTHAELLNLVGEDGLVAGEGPALAPSVAARFGPNDLRVR